MKRIGGSLACIVALASLQVACSSGPEAPPEAGPGEAPTTTVPTRQGKAVVRVVHASADTPPVDVYPKGASAPIVTGLAYGQTSGWLEIDPGEYELELRAAGAAPTDPVLYKTEVLTLQGGEHVTALAAGLSGSSEADAALRVIPVVETWGVAQAGTARVRVIHAGADAPAVGIDVGNDNPKSPEIASLARFADTGGEGIALPAGAPLWIGVDAAAERVTSFTTPALPDGANVLVVATGLLGESASGSAGFSLLAIGPNGNLGFIKQDPRLYAMHASPDAPRVDAFIGHTEVLDDLGFAELQGPLRVQPGTYALDFFAHEPGPARPAGDAAASATTGALAAGETYLTVATGFLAAKSNAFRLATYREGFARASSAPELRAVHASPDAPKVDVGVAGTSSISPVLFADLAFGDASPEPGIQADAGHLPIGITPAGANGTIVKRFTVPVEDGQRAFVVAAGTLGASPQAFRLLVVDTSAEPWSIATVHPH